MNSLEKLKEAARRQGDGTTKRIPNTRSGDDRSRFYEEHWATDPERPVDSFLAAQLGLWQIISAMRPYSFDLTEWLASGSIQSRQMQIHRVFFDWPRAEEDGVPIPSVTIAQDGEGMYDHKGLTNTLDEETADKYGEGTVLKNVGLLNAPIQLVFMLATKDDRSGVRRAVEDAFLDEPSDERQGRRIVVAPYYDQVVRYSLVGQSYPDDDESAQANQWLLVSRLVAEVPVVKLVRSPSRVPPPSPALSVG